ncbi:hypothetical protein ONA70_01100 [Micromonospora yasonensis]|uniref:hypothetical protein n=1 Tax=Micromonospora yasonensis TaxID=1128667 RepID=UPI0022323DBD|nr:hypothetical protein [Micromonospora yasonensis]MCW3838695.1 hypothetical protein [Micromonospora yasonensis]
MPGAIGPARVCSVAVGQPARSSASCSTCRRASHLTVTDAGRVALADTEDWYGRVLTRALADWSPGEVAALSAALGRFTRDLEVALAHHDNLEDAR